MALSQSNTLISYAAEPTDGPLTKGIIISNFPEQITIEDVRIHCSIYGSIEYSYMYTDLNKNRRAYVTFCKAESVMRALDDKIFLHTDGIKVCRNLENSRELQVYLKNHRGNISINKLSDDCLFEIFRYLSIARRYKLREVCLRWCRIANMSLQTVGHLDLGFHFFEFLETGYVTVFNTKKRIEESLRYLKEIELPSKKSLLNCTDPAISTVDLVVNLHFLAMKCTSLNKLIIRSSTSDERILSDIFMMNKKLRHIEIYDNEYIRGESLIHLSENIHTFVVERCIIMNSSYLCAALRRLKNLKYLRLAGRSMNDVLNIVNEHCQNLVSLNLDFQRYQPILIIGGLLTITNLKNLRSLKISSYNITDIFLVELSKNCQNLTVLELNPCITVGRTGIYAIEALPKLEVLFLHRFISWDGFNNLRGLRKLYYKDSYVEEQQVVTLMWNCPELRYLNFTKCYGITENIFLEAINISASRCNDVALQLYFQKDITPACNDRRIIYNGKMY